ncbi:MAG: hypothetical protein HUJ65_00800, partial [Oscillospiraceae bacterium]|nr:hypothetical protein [Oscillospiraceae bacterium]
LMVPRYFAHRRKYRKYLANENVHNLGFTFSGNRAEALPEALHRFYLDNGLDTRLAYHITLVLEEFLALVVRKNQGANVNIEVCIVIRHGRANILSWDDGVVTSIDTEALVREQLSEEKMILLISDSVKSSRVFDLNYYTFSIIDTSAEKSI